MNISGSSGSTAGVQNHSSETQRSRSTGDLSKNLQSVKNKTEQKSEALSRISSISRLPKGQPNIEPSKSIRVPQGPGGIPQITQMGVYTLDSGNGGTSTSLKINVPARHVGDPLVKYSLAKMELAKYSLAKMENDETFVRTLDRKERMALIADSKNNSAGNKLISTEGIQCGDKIIPWDNFIAWQKPETSTFDKPNNAAKLILFFRKGEGVAVLNEANRLNLNHLCKTTETLDCFYPARLCNKSPDLHEIKVSEYVDSLIHEFGTAVPERVALTKRYAEAMDSYGKDKLYHLRKNIDAMCTDSNGKSREALGLSHRYRHEQAKGVSEAKKTYAQGIKALSADWDRPTSAKNWSDNDTLRCAVIENVIKSGHANRISDADAKKYFPTIYTSKRFNQYINTVYANSGYQIALRSMVNSNDFSGIQGINEVSPRARAENIKSAISNLEELALLNPKKIRRELKRNEKELLNHLEQNSTLDKDVKTLAYGKEIDKLSNQLNLLKNKAYRKEIASLKMELKKITEPEPGSMEHMVATSLSRNNVQSKYSEKSIDTLRALRDEKVLGLRGNENKHERECLRQQIAWLDNHIESVVETYYGFLSLKDKVDFLLQESDIAWGKYADYLSEPVDKELVRKYHHMAITRNSQLKYLISAIKKISNENYIFSPGDIEHISNQISNPNCLCIPDIPDGIKFDKKVFRSLEKTRDSFSEFSTWAWYQKYNATHDPVSRNTLRNKKLSDVSINKNEPLADSDNVEKSLQVKDNVNPKNKDTLRKEIINEIDFKKYYSQIDGEIAVLALYSYLAERNVQLNILEADKESRVPIELIAAGRGLNIKKLPKTDNSVSIILDSSHYSGFDPKEAKTHSSERDGNCLFHSVAKMLEINNIKMEGINKIVDGVYLNQLTKEHFNNNFDKFIAAFFNSNDESDITNGKHTKDLFRLVKEYKNLPLETVESGATASGDANSGDAKLTYDLSDEEVVRENIDDGIDELLAGNTSLSKAGDDVPTAEDPHPDEPLTTETTTHQSNESVEDLNSDNKSMASTGATASGGINFHEINVNGYAFKSIKELEAKANTISNRAEKKRLLKTIKELKSALRNAGLKNYEVTENGITYTVSQKQKDLNVEVKYFYNSKFECNEDATEYKPISGNGYLKIPGVNGKIDTIPGQTYKRMLINTSMPEVLPDGYSQEDITAAKELIPDKQYQVIRTLTESEQKDFIAVAKLWDKKSAFDRSYFAKKLNDCFQQSETLIDFTENARSEFEQEYGKEYLQKILDILSSRKKQLQEKLKEVDSKYLENIVATNEDLIKERKEIIRSIKDKKILAAKISDFNKKIYEPYYKKNNEQMAEIKKEHDDQIEHILSEKGLKLKAGMYDEFPLSIYNAMPLIPYYMVDDTTVALNVINNNYGNLNVLAESSMASLSFLNTPLKIAIDSIFIKDSNALIEATDVKGVINSRNHNNTTSFLFPSECLIKKFESIRNGNDTMMFVIDDKKTIFGNNKESMDTILEHLDLTPFSIKTLNSGPGVFSSRCFLIQSPETTINSEGYYLFDNERYNKAKELAESKADKKAEHKGAKGAGKIAKDVPTVKSTSSSVNEKVAQALPQPPQVPSQSLQEKAANKATISGQENIRKDSSAHYDASAISTDNVNQSQDIALGNKYLTELGNKIIARLDFNKYWESIDGEIAPYALGFYLDSLGIKLNILETDSMSTSYVKPVRNDRNLYMPKRDSYNGAVNIILENNHYNGYESRTRQTIVAGDGDCLFQAAAEMLNKINTNEFDKKIDGKNLAAKTAEYLKSSEYIEEIINAFFTENDKRKINRLPPELEKRSKDLFKLVELYQKVETKLNEEAEIARDKASLYEADEADEADEGGGMISLDKLLADLKKDIRVELIVRENKCSEELFNLVEQFREFEKKLNVEAKIEARIAEYRASVAVSDRNRGMLDFEELLAKVQKDAAEERMLVEELRKKDEQPASALDENASILKVADDSSHVSKSSESDDNETVAAQPSNGTPAGKAPKEFFSKRELSRILSRQSVLVQ